MGLSVSAIVQLLYGIPSLILMVFFTIILSTAKVFSYSFYRLVQFDIVINFFCYFNSWLGIRVSQEWFGRNLLTSVVMFCPSIMNLSAVLIIWFFHAQNVSSFLLCLHRLTTMVFVSADKFWKNFCWLVMILGMFYSTLAWGGYRIAGVSYNYYIENDTMRYQAYNVNTMFTINPIFAVIYFGLILSSGIATIYIVGKKFRAANSSQSSKFMRKLAFVTAANSFVMSGNLLYTIVFGLETVFEWNIISRRAKSTTIPFASDMITLAMPWILLALDGNVHKFFGFTKQPKKSPVISLTQQN
ncbi:unnamed protein product [Caenorhabditis auriculariae]|uniref:Serpentine receptor class gamma n=1 Tax=Caenorhabditis auriculariae TaxID=2777116 RepID=A0A8S1GPV2_9PELO|nr:unnamed protein product [Caenorhabditis auriculariae]